MEKDKKQTIKEIVEILKEIEIIGSNSALRHIDEKELKFTSKSLFRYKIDFIKSLYDEINNKLFEIGETDETESRLSFSPSKSFRFNMNDNSNDSKDILNSVFDYFKTLETQFSLFNHSMDLCLEKWKIISHKQNLKKVNDQNKIQSTTVKDLIGKFEQKNFHNVENLTRCLESLEKDKSAVKGKIDLFLESLTNQDTNLFIPPEMLNKKKQLHKSTMTQTSKKEIIDSQELKKKAESKENSKIQVVVERVYLGLMECSISKSVDKISATLSDTNSSTCLSVKSEGSYLAIQESYGLSMIIDNNEFYSAKPKKVKKIIK